MHAPDMMRKLYYLFTLTLAAVLLFLITNEKSDRIPLTLLLWFPATLSAVGSALFFEQRNKFSIGYFVVSHTSMLALIAGLACSQGESCYEFGKENVGVMLFFFACSIVAMLTYGPLRYIQRQRRYLDVAAPRVSESLLEQTLRGMKSARSELTNAATGVQREIGAVALNLDKLQDALSVQREELEKAHAATIQAKAEAEHFRALGSLSKEQQIALLAHLSRSKYTDYFVGFVLGIVGALLIEAAKSALQK